MTRTFRILCLPLMALTCFAIALATTANASNIYALQFRDGHTHGSWVLAFADSRVYEISFTQDSAAKAIEALAALDPEIIRLNTAPELNIYLVGELLKSDPVAGKAEMRLDGWYIKAPFYLPPQTDLDGLLRVGRMLTANHFMPAGERPDSEATLKLRQSLVIHHDKRLNLFWFGKEPPINKFLEKE